MSGHTPGPWRFRNHLASGGPIEVSTGTKSICDVAPHQEMYEAGLATKELISEGKANARLIAAAPELLTFVRKIAGFTLCDEPGTHCYQDSGPCCGEHGGRDGVEDEVREARSLAAKAEGK